MKNFFLLFSICLATFFSCIKKENRTLVPAPEVTRIYPSSGYIGDIITISGKRFLADTTANVVSFGGKTAKVLSVSGDSSLKVIVPNGAVTGNMIVGSSDGAASGQVFTVLTNPNPPQLNAVSSLNIEVGEVITITGSNFVPTTNADTLLNQVSIDNKRLIILNATSTQLTALVPAGSMGIGLNLNVIVKGASSSALKVNVNGFAGSLFWTLIPTENKPNDKIRQLIAKVAADGSTGLDTRTSMAISDDSSTTRNFLKYSISGPKAFSPKANLLYYARTDRADTLWKLPSPNFNRFDKILTNDESGGQLFNTTALAVRESNQNVFYAYGNSVNLNIDFFGFTSDNIQAMVAGENSLYLLTGLSTLKKILYSAPIGGEAVEVNTVGLPIPEAGAAGIVGMQYSALTKSLYLIFQQNLSLPLKLYQLNEIDGKLKLLADNLPQFGNSGQSKYALLDAPTGPKLYGIGFVNDPFQSLKNQVIYMVNLKIGSTGSYKAVILYRDILKLPGKNETSQLFPSSKGEIPFNKVDFLFADDN